VEWKWWKYIPGGGVEGGVGVGGQILVSGICTGSIAPGPIAKKASLACFNRTALSGWKIDVGLFGKSGTG